MVMDQNPNSIVVTDVDGKIEYVNPQFEKTTGYAISEVYGEKPSILKSDKTDPKIFEELWQTISKGDVWTGEFTNKNKDGHEYIEHAIIAPISNSRGEIVNYVGIKENITEIKKAMSRAEEANRAKTRFIANMSHEIRTPLNGLIGFLQLLSETSLDTKQTEYVDTIRLSADSLLGVLNDILDISKIEFEKLEIENVDFDIHTSVSSVSKMFYAKAYEKDIDLLVFVDPRLPRSLVGDPMRINQVLGNLLGNAIKFTPECGEIEVRVEYLGESNTDTKVNFVVCDTGTGIPEDKLEDIFNSFTQVDASVTRKYGGTGLGLTISRDIIINMGSDIHVESEVGEGSCFNFRLSLGKPEGCFQQGFMISNPPEVALLGDKNAKELKLVKMYLDSFGCKYEHNIDILEIDDDKLIVADSSVDFAALRSLDRRLDRVAVIASEANMIPEDILEGSYTFLTVPFDTLSLYYFLLGEDDEPEAQADTVSKSMFSGNILLAEDNEINSAMMLNVLGKCGVSIELAEDGEKAVEMFKAGTYDLVLMDINMPKLDGINATWQIRDFEKGSGNKTPVVAITAHVFSENDKVKENDFDGYLSKPFNFDDLQNILKKFLPHQDVVISNSVKPFDINVLVDEIGLPETVVTDLVSAFIPSSVTLFCMVSSETNSATVSILFF
jgi:PAS domain S-box-containing protein